MFSRKLLIALPVMLIAALPVSAEDSSPDPIDMLGKWTFATRPYQNGGGSCNMSGTMTVSPNPEAGLYDCEVTAVEECEAWGKSVVVQSCKVRRTRNQVAIRSVIEQTLEYKMRVEGLTYIPDNFALTVQSPDLMYGSLISAVNAPVEFRRSLDGIS